LSMHNVRQSTAGAASSEPTMPPTLRVMAI
jgi:hypothetical protein